MTDQQEFWVQVKATFSEGTRTFDETLSHGPVWAVDKEEAKQKTDSHFRAQENVRHWTVIAVHNKAEWLHLFKK